MTAASNDPLGVGIIGAGFMGQTYARTVQDLVPGAQVAGVAGGSRAPDLAKEYNVPCFDSYKDLVQDARIDLVCVATPHAYHAEQALAAARAGKHLLVDKPMATTLEDCDAILDVCREKDLKCSVTFTQRLRVGFAKTFEVLSSGRLGKVQTIRTYQMVPGGMDVVPGWQMQPENVGLLIGHGIHNFDAIRALTGREIATVYAKSRTLADAPVEGTTDAILTLDDGTVHYLFCSFEVPQPGFPRSGMGARIVCEKGLIDLDAYAETRVAYDGGDWEVLAQQPKIDWAGKGYLDPTRLECYAALLLDLVSCIRTGEQTIVTGWDGRQAVAAALAAYESSRTGCEVQL